MNIFARKFTATSASTVQGGSSGSSLPSGFVIPPGIYIFQGEVLNLSADGYYALWDPVHGVTARRIVYSGDVPTLMDSLALAAAVSVQDGGQNVGSLVNEATASELRLLCNDTINWAKGICDSLGNIGLPAVTSRVARALTGGMPSNYFDGHVLLEALVGGKWQLFDLAMGTYFNGAALKDALPLQAPVAQRIFKRPTPGPVSVGQFDADAWVELTLGSDTTVTPNFASELLRVLQIPGLDWTDGNTYFSPPAAYSSRASWILSLSSTYRVMDEADWLARFYP